MDASAIRKCLEDIDLTWIAAADAIGCSSSVLMNVAARRTESRRVARQLCLLIGRDVATVFPDIPRYAAPSRAEAHEARVEKARQRLNAAQGQSRNARLA